MVVSKTQQDYLYVECDEYGVPYHPDYHACKDCDTRHVDGCAYVPEEYEWRRNPCPEGHSHCASCRHGSMAGYGNAYKCRHPKAWKMKKARGKRVAKVTVRKGAPRVEFTEYQDIDLDGLL